MVRQRAEPAEEEEAVSTCFQARVSHEKVRSAAAKGQCTKSTISRRVSDCFLFCLLAQCHRQLLNLCQRENKTCITVFKVQLALNILTLTSGK